jgi:GT2 family glycosyltransferase
VRLGASSQKGFQPENRMENAVQDNGTNTENDSTLLLSIVIVSWNAKAFVENCLESLLTSDKPVSTEIVLVDNASTDGTPELVEERFPDVTLLRNDRNLGFARANNIGIAHSRGDYVCLVNSDVTFPFECFAPLLSFMSEHPAIGLSGPKMIAPDGETTRRSTMQFPTLWNLFCRALALDAVFKRSRLFGGLLQKDFAHDTISDVEVLNGWFWLVRRCALEQVGLLDERFFIYGEDIDWCRRFHESGWRVVFNPAAAAIHHGGASSDAAPVRFYLEMQRANCQFWDKYHAGCARLAYRGALWAHHLARILGYIAVFAVARSRRRESAFKINRSMAALLSLSRIRTVF